jgi:Flp pilus assembly protein TadD
MFMSRNDNWDRIRQSFADQFTPDGSSFIYRRSQKGEAIRVSARERTRFVDEFDGKLRRAKWMIYIGVAAVLVGIIVFSLLKGSNLSELAILAGVAIAMVPYLAFYRWAWLAPVRELEGRMPVAGARSPEEVRRLKFQRMSYGQLGTAALGGLAFPFIGSSHQDVFSGWNRLWLVFGGAIVLLAVIQAFRKWRFEQEDSSKFLSGTSYRQEITRAADEFSPGITDQLWRYRFAIASFAAIAFIVFTPAGKRLLQAPSFWPIAMFAFGGWALFSVARGLKNARIEPFVRGLSRTYEREMQPVPFWLSMAWNSIFGCFCFWIAFQMNGQKTAPTVQDRCYNASHAESRQEALSACNELVRLRPKESEAYLSRGLVYLDGMNLGPAVADFTRAHELDPGSPWPLANRGISYAWKSDRQRAEEDFEAVRKLDPRNPVLLHGEAVLDMESGDLEDEIRQLNAGLARNPADAWSLQMRADAYQQRGDFAQARADRNALAQLRNAAVGGAARS